MTEPNPLLLALDVWESHGEAPDEAMYEAMRNLAWRLTRAVDEIGREQEERGHLRRASSLPSSGVSAIGPRPSSAE